MSTEKSSLLWHSNCPWSPTGYGQQTSLICERLIDHYNLGISGFYGLEGNVLPWNGIPVYPGIGTTHGNEAIMDHAGTHFPDGPRSGLTVTLMDVWPLDATVWRQLNVASWVPVDHEPVPRPVVDFFLGTGAVPIAMSKFGERMLTDAGLSPLYCPHAVDCKTYKPLDKAESRQATGMPEDAFIVGMVAANKGNPPRKCFAEAVQAFKILHGKHPDARLYIHAEITGMFDGVNLPKLITDCGLDLKLVMFPDQYRVIHYPLPSERMAQIYNSFDVLLSPSAGEGFGLPVIEAQACGVPVVVSDFSAQPELCGAGWLVSGTRKYTPIGSWQFTPDVGDIADALRQAYDQPRDMAERARAHAEQYDLDHVFTEMMLPALSECFDRFDARKPVELAA